MEYTYRKDGIDHETVVLPEAKLLRSEYGVDVYQIGDRTVNVYLSELSPREGGEVRGAFTIDKLSEEELETTWHVQLGIPADEGKSLKETALDWARKRVFEGYEPPVVE